MAVESTAVTLQFSGIEGAKVVLEASSRKPDKENETFFRVHGNDGHRLLATTGKLARADTGLYKFTSEFITLNGTTFAALKYPNATRVTIKQLGTAIGLDGDITSLRPKFDPANNVVLSGGPPAYTSFLVEYDAPYELWRAIFAGFCPGIDASSSTAIEVVGPDDDSKYLGRDPMVIVAYKEGKVWASLSLAPPACGDSNEGAVYGAALMGASDNPIAMEVDKDYPIDFAKGDQARLQASCRVRVYPDDGAISIESTSGKLDKSTSESFSEHVTEIVMFTNTPTANLSYPPASSVISLEPVGSTFVDAWGGTFVPTLHKWGDSINAVQWINSRTFTNPTKRALFRSEIAVSNILGNAIPCTGSVRASYITKYKRFKFEFAYDSSVKEFVGTTLVAEVGGKKKSERFEGPQKRGVF